MFLTYCFLPRTMLIWRSDTFIERDGIEIRENKHYNYTYLAAFHHLLLHHGDLVLVGVQLVFTKFDILVDFEMTSSQN